MATTTYTPTESPSFFQRIWNRLWQYISTYPGMMWLWLIGLVLTSVTGINDAALALSGNQVITLGLVAMVFSAALARAGIKLWLASLSILSLGIEYVLIFWSNLSRALWQLLLSLTTLNGIPIPQSLSRVVQEGVTVLSRLQIWLNTGQTPNSDQLMLQLFWGLMLWLAISFLTWMVWKQGPMIIAIFPLGSLLALNIFFAQGPYINIASFIFFALLLQASMQHFKNQSQWDLADIDYSEGLVSDLNMVLLPIALFIVVLAFISPTLQYRPVTDFIYIVLNVDADGANEFAASFGIDSGPIAPSFGGPAGLPRSHLLGGARSSFNERLVMRVSTGELPPLPFEEFELDSMTAPIHYWQATTYNEYTSTNWDTSTDSQTFLEANQPLNKMLGPGRLVQQTVAFGPRADGKLYTSGTPLQVDQSLEVSYRSDGTPVSALVIAPRYKAESWLLEPTINELRSSSINYPEAIRSAYLGLPPSLPDRVRDLAIALTQDAPTAYDKALVLEAYLRQFPYNLEVDPIPFGEDVADYFIFNLQEGYCDYYATSMAVMARAIGLPSRFVVGYAPSDYDSLAAEYIVYTSEAHSWPQIYFPEIGWVDFEPTAGRAAIVRPEALTLPDFPVQPTDILPDLPEVDPMTDLERLLAGWRWLNQSVSPFWLTIALLCVGGYLYVQIDLWWLRRQTPTDLLQTLYDRLLNRAKRTGYQPHVSHTPYEFARYFNHYLDRHLASSSLSQAQPINLDQLIEFFVRQTYAQPEHPVAPSWKIVHLWQQVRVALLWAAVMIWLEKWRGNRYEMSVDQSV